MRGGRHAGLPPDRQGRPGGVGPQLERRPRGRQLARRAARSGSTSTSQSMSWPSRPRPRHRPGPSPDVRARAARSVSDSLAGDRRHRVRRHSLAGSRTTRPPSPDSPTVSLPVLDHLLDPRDVAEDLAIHLQQRVADRRAASAVGPGARPVPGLDRRCHDRREPLLELDRVSASRSPAGTAGEAGRTSGPARRASRSARAGSGRTHRRRPGRPPEAREADDAAARLDPLEQVLAGRSSRGPSRGRSRSRPGCRACRSGRRASATSPIASSTTEFVMRICSLAARNRPCRSASVVTSQPILIPGSPSAFDSDETPIDALGQRRGLSGSGPPNVIDR